MGVRRSLQWVRIVSHLRTIKDHWSEYAARVLPANCHPTQMIECRRAFYSGAYALLANMVIVGDDDSITEDDGVAHLASIQQELNAFYADVKAGVK